MWLPPVTSAAPASEPVALADAKEYLRIDDADTSFDGEVDEYIAAARGDIEDWSSTRLITQTVTVMGNGWSALDALPIGPVVSIESIKYIDTAGVEQTWAAENYELAGSGLRQWVRLVIGKRWPVARKSLDAIRLTVIVGYGDAGSDLPSAVRYALIRGIRAKMDQKPFDLLAAIPNHRIWL